MDETSPAKVKLGGTDENQNWTNHSLCDTCTKMVSRPFEEWDNKTGSKICYRKRAVDDIDNSSKSGCIICHFFHKAVSHVLDTRPWLKEHGISCMFQWNQETCKFEDIRISLAQVSIILIADKGMVLLIESLQDFEYS
jgi:hypothetical protein